MRTATIALLVMLMLAAGGACGRVAAASRGGCALASEALPLRLPAAVTITTDCGAFRVSPDGHVRQTSTNPSPVPPGAGWWPYTGVWDKLVGGHLVVGRWQKQLWRSSGSFPRPYDIGAITVSPQAVAFSYGNRVPRLYLAALGGRERLIATGEYPVGWTRGGLYTSTSRGAELRLRSADGALVKKLARQVHNYAYDHAAGSLYFLAHGNLVRADGATQHPIASLAQVGLSAGRSLQLQPLGRLVALQDRHRLVVLRRDGSLFASTRLPHGPARIDGISSQLAAAPDGHAVAFAATRGNTAYGSNGSETVYLLRPGSRAAQAIHAERVSFAVCERGASLQWQGRWLLYAASEGNTSIIDTTRSRRTIELTRLVRSLPGVSGGEGNLNFSAYWSGHPTGV